MENNFELEEMKQQWTTLQTALNNQKEINIKLILKDAKRRISWNKRILRTASLLLLLIALPVFLSTLPKYGVPQPIYITLNIFIAAYALHLLYMSFIIKNPNGTNIDIVKYSKTLIKFKKRYIISEAIGVLILIIIAIWAAITMGFDITHPLVRAMTIASPIAIIGITPAILRFLNNIKELQSDIDLIDKLEE